MVLAINGSPHIGGNTDILIDSILAGVKRLPADRQIKIEKIQLSQLKIKFCKSCDTMSLRNLCNTKDDMKVIFRKIKQADVLIVGSPIFFGSLTAQLKAMIDRFQCFWVAKYLFKKNLFKDSKKRIGIFVSCSAVERKDFFNNAKSIIKNFFATIGVKYTYELFCPRVDKKADVLKYPQIIKKARLLGAKIAYGL